MQNCMILVIINLAMFIRCEYARYDNYRLYNLFVETPEHEKVVNALTTYSDSYIFLKTFNNLIRNATVIVPPHKFGEFSNILKVNNINYEILNNNVQDIIDVERNGSFRSNMRAKYNWKEYKRLNEIYDWMKSLAKTMPNKLSLLQVGKSYEGRAILGIKLSFKRGNPGVVLESGIHAREWIAPAVVTYMLNALIYSNNTQIRNIAESYDWYIIPILNPDGYEYTHTTDRYWRKTRKPYGKTCYGADPNRNWNIHWGEVDSSSSPCSDI